jgi:predicted transcriptional regulator
MTDEEQRQRIIDEIADMLNIDHDVPKYAMTKTEMREDLNVGERVLSNILKELEKRGRLNKAKTYRLDKAGRNQPIMVFWFDDEENTLHSDKQSIA